MKPRTLQIHLQKELSRLYDAHEAAAIATRYVTDRFGLSTAQLLLNDDVLLSAAEEEQTQRDVEQLLAQVPVQQVVGFEWFCGHRFRVTADTILHQPPHSTALPLYPDLFTICSRSRQKIRRIQRRMAGNQTHRTMPSFRRTRT